MISRKICLPISLTIKELADEFCNLDGDSQADFFNEVGKNVKTWERHFGMQLTFIR